MIMELSISRCMNSIFICHFLLYEKVKKLINMFKKKKEVERLIFISQEVWQVYIKSENS